MLYAKIVIIKMTEPFYPNGSLVHKPVGNSQLTEKYQLLFEGHVQHV